MTEVKVKGKRKPVGFREVTLSQVCGKKQYIENLGGNLWIIPQKLDVQTMQRILEIQKIRKMGEEDEKAIDEAADKMESKVEEMIAKGEIDDSFYELLKIAFIGGVYDHNFMEPEYETDEDGNVLTETVGLCEEDENGDPLLDENGDYCWIRDENGEIVTEQDPVLKLDENGEPIMKKMEWGENIYEIIKHNSFALLEINQIIMRMNRPPGEKTGRKSPT